MRPSSMSILRILTFFKTRPETTETRQRLAVYVALGFVAVEVTYFSACRPFWGYWSVPPIEGKLNTDEDFGKRIG